MSEDKMTEVETYKAMRFRETVLGACRKLMKSEGDKSSALSSVSAMALEMIERNHEALEAASNKENADEYLEEIFKLLRAYRDEVKD